MKDDLKKLLENAGISEGNDFETRQHLGEYVVRELRKSLQNYEDDPDHDAYYVVNDVERILSDVDAANIG